MMKHRRSALSVVLLATLVCLSSSLAGAALPRAHHNTASDTFIYGGDFEPDTLNTLITQAPNSQVIGAVFDSLLLVDPQGHLQPDLATSVDHSPDGRTWTFHLRHGVKWADGQPFTSADVVYNYQALFVRGHNIPSTLGWDQIDRYGAPDDYTFTCHLKRAFAPFLLYVGWTELLPKHIYDRPGVDFNKTPFNRTPFGTGPYRVSEWQAGDHITLVANPYSWRGQPFAKKIIYKIVPDRDTRLAQLQTGALDMAQVAQSQAAPGRAISGKHLVSWLSTCIFHIALKQWGFLREKAVRQALDYATPKEAIFKGISNGLGSIAYGDVLPLLADYYNPNVPKHPFTLATAAALLAKDGFAKGPDGVLRKGGQPLAIELWADTFGKNQQLTNDVLRQEWGRIGIEVTTHVASGDVIGGPNGPTFSKAMTGIAGADCTGPDPDDSFLWNSKWIPRSPSGAGANFNAYYHQFAFQKQIDALTNAGLTTVDPAKRRAIYVKEQVLLADEVPSIFLYWIPNLMVLPNDLQGFVPNSFSGPLWNVGTWRRG